MSSSDALRQALDPTKDHAIIVAVECYRKADIARVKHGRADAEAVAATLCELGMPAENQTLLYDGDATYATIGSAFRRVLKDLARDERCFIYYVGHGFYEDGSNYLTAYDTDRGDLLRTAYRLQKLMGLIKESECKRIVLFLDACHIGVEVDDTMRDTSAGLEPELDIDEHYCTCFASCRSDQKSRSHDDLGHGIWTHHLLPALRGEEPGVLRDGTTWVDARLLQEHLFNQVRLTARKLFTGFIQTPKFFGSYENTPLIVDVGPLLKQRERTPPAVADLIPSSLSVRKQFLHGFRSMSGFNKKHHSVPDRHTAATEAFARQVSVAELSEASEAVAEKLKKLGCKRSERKPNIGDGTAVFVTARFEYRIEMRLDPDDTSQIIEEHWIGQLEDLSILLDEQFNEVFDDFDGIVICAARSLNVESLVDHLEEMDDAPSFDADAQCTYCDIDVGGLQGRCRVTSEGMHLSMQQKAGAAELLAAGTNVIGALKGTTAAAALLGKGARTKKLKA